MMPDDVLDRLKSEGDELEKKIRKLGGFIGSFTFANLAEDEGLLLQAQLGAMSAYLSIVTMRLKKELDARTIPS